MSGETYEVYYDEEGDFLEVSFGIPPETEYTEDIQQGIFVTRDEETKEVKSIGILEFKKKAYLLKKILSSLNKKLPIEISIPSN